MRNISLLILTLLIIWTSGFLYYLYLINSYKQDSTVTNAIAVIASGGDGVETATGLLKAGYAPILFITGISSSTEQLKNYFQEQKIPEEQLIYAVNEVFSEKEYAKKIVNFIITKNLNSIRLVASSYTAPIIINIINKELPVTYQLRIAVSPIKEDIRYMAVIKSYNKYLVSFF